MRKIFGSILIGLGLTFFMAAVALFIHNRAEQTDAAEKSAELLPQIRVQIEQNMQESESANSTVPPEQPVMTPVEYLTPQSLEMKETVIDGHAYIGYLSVPTLELDLPVMADWSYDKLKIAPCRYAGTLRGGDLVIMAHNYTRHFGQLSTLTEGNQVFFTDMDGKVTAYTVVATDILVPQAVEEMTAGDFDLTLFTCTYGGKSRVTVYCNKTDS